MSLSDPLVDIPLGSRQVNALVILLTVTILPHWWNLGGVFILFFLSAALWRLGNARGQVALPGKWLLAVLMLVGLGLVIGNVSLRDGRLAGTALLIVMLGLKLLELRSHRDIYICIFLGFFVILTQFLFNTSLWLALYLFGLAVLLIGLLVTINRCRFEPAAILRSAAIQVALAFPTTLLLFVLFPRLDSPLWAITIHDSTAFTGISGEIRMGDIGRLSQSEALAFRAEFEQDTPLPAHLYWRGPVLWDFDGRTWSAGKAAAPLRSLEVEPESRVDYELTLEPSGQRWVFALDIPSAFPQQLQLNDNHQLVASKRLEKRALYKLSSHIRYRLDDLTPLQRQQGLQLPAEIGDRTLELANRWRARHPGDDRAVINEALRFFNREEFIYTLSPGTSEGDPIEDFLFDKRRGFCEHYASSFTLLMRLAGIPARVVAGYQGGSRNPLGGSLSIYQSDAHAWSEVWLQEQGWVRIDPTAAVAPERVERTIDIAGSTDQGRIVFESGNLGWFRQLARGGRWMVDAVEFNWNRWVLGFNPERQKNLFDSLGLAALGHYATAFVLSVFFVTTLSLLLLATRQASGRSQDPVHADWKRYQGKLRRAGLEVPEWMGPERLLTRAEQRWPAKSVDLREITRRYVQLRYGQLHGPAQQKQLKQQIRRLRIS